jgi:ABC-type nitrate/sulfonate/bicarbonate transport system substrate-binding protein
MIAPSLLYLASNPSHSLLVLKEASIQSARDLPGNFASCSAIRDVNWVSIRAWADQHGVDPSTITFVELPMSAVPAAFEQRRVDVGSLLDPSLGDALATGHVRSIGAPVDGVAKRWLVAAWSTTVDFVNKNRETVDRFASAIHSATLFAAFAGRDSARADAMKPVDLVSISTHAAGDRRNCEICG